MSRKRQTHAYQAICTKYRGPTNTSDSRVVVTAGGGKRMTFTYNQALDNFAAQQEAAYAFAEKMGWPGELVGGATKDGYCFVFVDRQ